MCAADSSCLLRGALALAATGLARAGCGGGGGAAATFRNPVLDADFPDPFVLLVGSTHHAHGTNSAAASLQAAAYG